ncbi:DUF2283 domain-containing protein [Candidatus Woesearchaeota archaeon]|nr:DUF2283 domain-containing protein [Candidatus Woesearchaeota archaeon]
MRIDYDEDADAMYIYLREGEFGHNKVIDDRTIMDYDKKGELLGIELLQVSKRMPKESLARVDLRNLKKVPAHP